MGADYIPYRARRGDVAELGKPYQFGEPTALIEMPISWSLDDHPHFEFIRTPQTVAPGLQPARAVMQSWLDEFLYMKKTVDWGVLTYTMHPYVIGRGYRMLALEWLVRQARQGGRGVHDHGAGGGRGEGEAVPLNSHFCSASFATCSKIGRQVFCSFCTKAVTSAGVMWRTKPPLAANLARIVRIVERDAQVGVDLAHDRVGRADRRQQHGPGADEEVRHGLGHRRQVLEAGRPLAATSRRGP